MPGTLYLIPNLLGSDDIGYLAPEVLKTIVSLDEFIVENLRNARRFLVKAGIKETGKPINDLIFHHMDKHAKPQSFSYFLNNAYENNANIGLLSDAGCPAIADPGARIVATAHNRGIKVVPLPGPSSILLALMASGLNGQQFAFNGYIPIENPQRDKTLLRLEMVAVKYRTTQIFMETPYRNRAMVDALLQKLNPRTRLCIAADLTLKTQYVKTLPIARWREYPPPDLHKRPAVFLIGR